MLVGLNKQDELAPTDGEHRYKYTGVNGEDGRHLEGLETITKQGETDQGVPSVGCRYM